MEEVKLKKSSFQKVVIVFNIIAIIFMIVIVVKFGIVEECTNTMRSSFESTKMELMQFNQKFITYEGVITGSQIKALVETVNASNLENDGTELVVSINERTNENQYVFKGGNAKKYKVEIEYDNNYLVNNINIYIKTQNVNNNVSTNYTEFAEITGYKQEDSVGRVENNRNNKKMR